MKGSKPYFLGALAGVALLGLSLAACGQRPREPREPTPGVPHFTVATYNVEAGRWNDRETVETVGATNADIICLQEIDVGWEQVLRERYAREYPHMLFYAEGSAGLGIMSRRPLIDGEFLQSPNGWHPAWSVLAETPAGWLNVLTVHLRSLYSGSGGVVADYLNWGSDHVAEIRGFLSESGQKPMPEVVPRLVAGDFNEGNNGEAVHYLESLGFTDVLPLYHPGQFTWRHPSIGNQFTEDLDHLMYDEWLEPLNAHVVNSGKSDHIPVVAHFESKEPWSSVAPSP